MLRATLKDGSLRHTYRHLRRAALCTISSSSTPAHPPHHHQPAHNVTQEASGHRKPLISASEISKFSAMAETWWDSKGPFKPLHMMNPTRISFIRSALCRHFKKDSSCAKPFEGLKFLDVGCGGGLLSEPLARLGAEVVGIDAVEKNIKIASAHALKDPVTASIEYICCTSDNLSSESYGQFDAVISLEVIEHVTEPKAFLDSLSALTKTDGAITLSTINRSLSAYILAIVAAEHLLHWVPKGTHEWSKFITPDELALLMEQAGLKLQEMAGMVFNPISGKWSLSTNTTVNYIAYGTKPVVTTA
ncbi:hypothetical protein GOP47_0002797 [Adiantum capillus-veneris]|uniref:Ubiquinone biosynthesis O-methyltransferase, mitochondrial n=1 Tax=Adiantum capillus-veneris TaxID=13818 RepID=A0A9D4VB08_ADICA|nr:hypothetical protein GOP47_0002797 [Adiantum capillus-veneris]